MAVRASDAYRAVVDKRDQRVYLPKPIPDEALRRILQAARMTGSSKNREPNRLIVVTEREGVRALAALSEWGRWLAHGGVPARLTAFPELHTRDDRHHGRCPPFFGPPLTASRRRSRVRSTRPVGLV